MKFIHLCMMMILSLGISMNAQQNISKADTTIILSKDSVDNGNNLLRTDTSAKSSPINHRLFIGMDIARIGLNFYNLNKQSYDFQVVYNHSLKNYWALEFGLGRGKVDYEYLKYKSDALYLKLGIDRSLLDVKGKKDFDIAFIGVRYGMSLGNRSDAWYSVTSPFGGITEGSVPGTRFFLHWGEITAGMRLEVWKRVHIGWIGRGKFLFNGGSIAALAPNFVPGYGKADNATSFDIGLYLTYAIREWKK